jgi:HD-GYP domain-containing protein (c-di-GMP phosphodiesterase class II)
LTPEEFAHVQEHVTIGMSILAPLEHLGVVLEFVHDHHEHWNGAGYPRGRRGEEISVGGRILVAADAFDALTSKRAYRDPMTPELVIDMLGAEAVGTLLDPAIFASLRAVVLESRSSVLPYIDDVHA